VYYAGIIADHIPCIQVSDLMKNFQFLVFDSWFHQIKTSLCHPTAGKPLKAGIITAFENFL
jgi:hypothetical protein